MPDNVAYLNLGLLVVVGLAGSYVLLLVLRFRSAYQNRQIIQGFQEEHVQTRRKS